MRKLKIISGGQTGVDRAASDAAINLKLDHGGWCPKGRRAELNQIIPKKYHLQETESAEFSTRTKLNVKDSDGSWIIAPSVHLTGGTLLTKREAQSQKKPYLIICVNKPVNLDKMINWIKQNNIHILNIAGPRESPHPAFTKKV